MKAASKKDLIGKVANNPRYDREYGLDSGWDADAIKKEKEDILYGGDENQRNRITKRLKEIYAGRYGYRQTASGKYVERDYPDADTELKQADAINKVMQKRKSAASRERLKTANKVPTRVATGKKLFDEFMIEVYEKTGKQRSVENQEDLKQVYLAARALDFDKFLIFLTDVLK
jgi:hypothetical protein